jgi:cytochrome c oxidase subunit 3/cytochrome o ubiquinol oxidase subunit 3
MPELAAATAPLPESENTKLGVWIFLGGEVAFFGILIGVMLFFRALHAPDFSAARAHLSIPLIGLNTFILILSSFFVVRALEAIHAGERGQLRTNLAVVTLLGAIFLGGQVFEWTGLYASGLWFGTNFGTPFFTLTGIHGAHVLVGLIWSLLLQFNLARGAFSAERHQAIEVFGLYWHFVDVVWIVLFTLFYLI